MSRHRTQDLPAFRTDGLPLPAQGEWTYEDYLRLPDDGWRYEVLKGVLHMTPAPGPMHQDAVLNLATQLRNHLQSNPLGKVYIAPLDVLLQGGMATPIQPDIVFLSNERRGLVTGRAIEGSPDLVAEVLSPSSWLDDRRTKSDLYAEAGVPEYWIVDPRVKTVEDFLLEHGVYTLLGRFSAGERVRSQVLPQFAPDVDEIFAE